MSNVELVIIHNYYNDEISLQKFTKVCNDSNIKYVPRNGQGYDIGAMQDVFRERLQGFPNDWTHLLWCTDDWFPMSTDFIHPFIEKLEQPGVGISCTQLSTSVSPHVRTSGFCIRKEIASKITFPVDPVTTKTHCYFFEHRGGPKTFTNQIRAMGLSTVNKNPNRENLKPFQKGVDKRRNLNGAPKLPDLKLLMAEVLGEDKSGKSAALQILDALQAKAAKGDHRCAEILLNRGYGLPKQFIEHSIPGKIRVTISNE